VANLWNVYLFKGQEKRFLRVTLSQTLICYADISEYVDKSCKLYSRTSFDVALKFQHMLRIWQRSHQTILWTYYTMPSFYGSSKSTWTTCCLSM